jgi:hypothetical protein|tara:strand:- start:1697 stop:2272 length:576 start_codon:yes stop_codon:yes gene_type:complete
MEKRNKKGLILDESYDQMKDMLNLSRRLHEQVDDIEIDVETVKEEKTKEYAVGGSSIIVHGVTDKDLNITSNEELAFTETMEGFIDSVEDLADFNELNVYKNNIEWSGKLVRFDLEFFYSIGESNGIYINGTMIKVDEDLYGMLDKLKTYYKTFSTKWSQILSERKGSVEPSADSSEAESEEDKQIGDVPL